MTGEYAPGTFLVVRGGLGIPSLVRVREDGGWTCVEGVFKGREIGTGKHVCHVCREGDEFEDLGLVVRGGELIPVGTQ